MQNLLTSSEFLSAIVGAIVGGLIAFGVQMVALKEARRTRAEDRRSVEQALANSLLFKMMRIHANLIQIHKHIEERYDAAEKEKLGGEPWSFVQPIANPPQPIHFTPEEMGMLLAQKNNDVVNAMLPMDEVHNSVVETAVLYREYRAKLTERLPPPRKAEGAKLTGHFSEEEWLALRPYMINTNSLIEQLRKNAAADAKEAEEVLNRLHSLLKERGLVTFNIEKKG